MPSYKNYIQDTRGNFSIMMGLGVSIIALGVAVALEIGNMGSVKNTLQSQVDMATLAAASTQPDSRNEKIDYESIIFDNMVANGYDPKSKKPDVKLNGNFLDVSLQVSYGGYFNKLLGDTERNISVNAQSTLPSLEQAEIVMVLDNTASMTLDGKLTALKTGAENIIDLIKDSGSGTKIGIVPFARYINVGENASGSWLDKPSEYDTNRVWDQATRTGGTCRTETVDSVLDGVPYQYDTEVCDGQTTTYETKSKVVESRFKGCVGTTDEPDHLAPISSTNRVPGLLNNHVKEVTGLSRDTTASCPLALRPLDDDYTNMKKFVNEMYGTDVTYIPSGLLWGERMLDRTDALKQDAKEEGIRQIMILMTDGQNTAEIRNDSAAKDELQSPPYIYHDLSATISVPKANADTELLCNRIKGKGTELFTISFKVNDVDAKTLVQNCATSNAHAFTAESNDELIEVFDQIGKRFASNVRLTR